MQHHTSEVTKIQRKVLVEVAKLAFQGDLVEKVDSLPRKLTDEGLTNYRCCEYKERAILSERIRLAMGLVPGGRDAGRLSDAAASVWTAPLTADGTAAEHGAKNVVKVIDIACDKCPIDKIVVTDSCRNCVGHFCRNTCPKDAIHIIDNRAFVDKSRCVECGKCVKACPFGAILQLERPCERSCKVKAISPGDGHSASIDETKCVNCGACTLACPFGAISSPSDTVKVIKALGLPSVSKVAFLAPSFVGQFGPAVTSAQLRNSLLELGFDKVVEVAAGAETAAAREAEEFADRAHEGASYMTTSCCPAFVDLIRKHFPGLADCISTTPSPMAVTAAMVKDNPEAYGLPADKGVFGVFIGPCLAKKKEAKTAESKVDAVLTFEELAAMLVAKDINVAAAEKERPLDDAGWHGRIFARSGGPSESIHSYVAEKPELPTLRPWHASGLDECIGCLISAGKGELAANFIEGMACCSGCIGGPGTLVNPLVAGRLLSKFIEGTLK